MEIRIQNLVKTFGSTRAVDDISFSFGSGDIFGFIGPNGAGKTTTIRIMSTLDLPDSGDVFYDGVSVVNDPEAVRRLIGYMPDSLPEFRDIQVWEYLDFFARTFGLKGEKRTRILAEVEEFTGLGSIRHKYLAALSKGMKQRVSLARALVHNPPVLVMDEPAAGLDPRARLELRSLLRILSQQGKAILLSSHILSELQDTCNGAVIIEQGKLLSAGKLNELLINRKAPAGAVAEVPMERELVCVIIECGGPPENMRGRLLEQPTVREVRLDESGRLETLIDGDEQEINRLMVLLLNDGFIVSGFHRRRIGLEELFMKITTGGVQ
jgi:ABC-2 type transport system ATP-binding protein